MKYSFPRVDRSQGYGSAKWMGMPDVPKAAGAIPLSVADMEIATTPELAEALSEAAKFGLLGYTDVDDTYKKALVGWYQRRHGYGLNPEQLCYTFGVVQALNVAVRTYTQPGDKVIIQPPAYPPFRKATINNGRELLENPLINEDGKYSINFDQFEQLCKDPAAKLFILCNPHNPVGRVWTQEELLRMGRICIDNGVLILSDEIHFDLVYAPHKHLIFPGLSEEFAQHSITAHSLSKTFNIAGLTFSHILIPNDILRQRFLDQCAIEGFGHIPYFAYPATIAAYNKCDAWVDQLLAFFLDNYQLAKSILAEKLPQAVVSELEGTYLMWVDLRFLGLRGDAFADFIANNAKIWANPGIMFGEEEGDGFLRIALPAGREDIETAVHQLCDAANAHLAGK